MPLLLHLMLVAAVAVATPLPKGIVRVRAVQTQVEVRYSVTAPGDPDSVVVVVTAAGQPTVRRRYLVDQFADSLRFNRPAPAQTLTGAVTITSYRRSLPSGPRTIPWSYTEPDQPPPVPDGTVEIRPVSMTVGPDVAGACLRWQQSNPGVSVWMGSLEVNKIAVPTCMSMAYDTVPSRPMVAQFCALAVVGDSTVQLACPCPTHPYAAGYCDRWLTTYQRNHPHLRIIRG